MTHKEQISEFTITPQELGQEMPALDQAADQSMNQSIGNAEHDDEGAMLKADLFKLAKYSFKLFKKIEDSDQYESWVQAKVTKAADYIASVYHYLEYEMKFSEYGSKLENSDVYSESEKIAIRNMLTEAKQKMKELKKAQVEKIEKDQQKKLDESFTQPCEACGGLGHVEKQIPEATKNKVAVYNRQSKAFRAAAKRLDRNHNGIPDNMEGDAGGEQFTKSKKDAPKLDAPKKEPKKEAPKSEPKSDAPKKEPKKEAPKSEPKSDAPKKEPKKEEPKKESSSDFGGSVYGEGKQAAVAMWNSVKESIKVQEAKKAKKDYDGDGEVESGEEEHQGSVDKAIKASKEKEKDCMNESAEIVRLRQLTERVIR